MAEERFDPLAIQDVDDEIFTEQATLQKEDSYFSWKQQFEFINIFMMILGLPLTTIFILINL